MNKNWKTNILYQNQLNVYSVSILIFFFFGFKKYRN